MDAMAAAHRLAQFVCARLAPSGWHEGRVRAAPGRSATASLQDERDRLIDSIARRVDVSVSLADNGIATLTLARAPGVTLIEPAGRGLVVLSTATDGRLSLSLADNGTPIPLPASGGTISGLVDVAASTADKRADLEAITAQFVSELNAWSAAGRDLAGNPGGPLLTMSAGALSVTTAITDPDLVAAASATWRAAYRNPLVLLHPLPSASWGASAG